FDLNIRNGGGFLAGAQRMFGVGADFKTNAVRAESMHQRGEGTVALAGKLERRLIPKNRRIAMHLAVLTGGFKSPKPPRFCALDVFAPELLLELSAPHFAPEAIHLVIRDGPEFTLHLLRQMNPELRFEQIRHAALATLRIYADHLAVFAADVARVNREIWHVPMLAALFPFGEPFLDGVLVRAAERREDEFAGIRLSRRNGHPSAAFVNLDQFIEIAEIQFRIYAVHVEIQRHRHDVQIPGAFAVAKKRAFHAIRAREQPKLSRRHARATIIVRMQTNDERLAILDIATNPFDLVRVNIRHRDLDRVRKIQNHFPLRRGLPNLHHGLGNFLREFYFRGAETFRRILQHHLRVLEPRQ